jgi:uncharacterized membrane protein YedE/YeeE
MWAKIQAWLKAHILLSIALLTSVHLAWMGYATAGGVVAAALKEYWYDATYELPKQTFKDNTEDFLGYCAGMAVGWAVTLAGFVTHLLTAH